MLRKDGVSIAKFDIRFYCWVAFRVSKSDSSFFLRSITPFIFPILSSMVVSNTFVFSRVSLRIVGDYS